MSQGTVPTKEFGPVLTVVLWGGVRAGHGVSFTLHGGVLVGRGTFVFSAWGGAFGTVPTQGFRGGFSRRVAGVLCAEFLCV